MNGTATRKHSIFTGYLIGFLYTLHTTLPVYINSSFLSQFTTEAFVGIIYTLSSLATILTFITAPRLLRRFGNYRITHALLLIELLALVALSVFQTLTLVAAAFLISFVAIALTGFTLDIFLERFSIDIRTGRIRGVFLTSVNAAWVIGPLIGTFIFSNTDYWKIFAAAALILVPVFFLLAGGLRQFTDPQYTNLPLVKTLKEIWRDRDIRRVFIASFLLQFFFSWMVIYTPIYLNNHIGFAWREIGIIFAIMLLPFVLIEMPLGRVADLRLGEKELLAVGFLIMAVTTGLISFIEIKTVALWAAVLFVTRIGAAMVEVMSETYFFKKINVARVNVISLFRAMRPWAYLLAPAVATVLLPFIPFRYLFLILGFLMFYGVRVALALKDTR